MIPQLSSFREILSEVQQLSGLVPDSSDSLVTRTIIQKQRVTLTLLSLRPGKAVQELSNPYDSLIYIIQGSAHVDRNGIQSSLAPGDILSLPADEPHQIHADSPVKAMLITVVS